jgi:hypothetical protein
LIIKLRHTGEINFDMRFILERDWHTLGPQLVGKLHIAVGTRDTYCLDNAVRLLQKFLESTNNPQLRRRF